MSADVLAWEDAPAVVTVSVLWLPLLVLTVLLLVQPGVVLHRPVVDLSSLSVTPSWGLTSPTDEKLIATAAQLLKVSTRRRIIPRKREEESWKRELEKASASDSAASANCEEQSRKTFYARESENSMRIHKNPHICSPHLTLTHGVTGSAWVLHMAVRGASRAGTSSGRPCSRCSNSWV